MICNSCGKVTAENDALRQEVRSLKQVIDDLKAENERLQKEIGKVRQWVSDLQSGMYINCVYCGHRYGPNKNTPVSMADVLKDHVEQCPEHPMSKLKTENERLKQIIAKHKDADRPRSRVQCSTCGNFYDPGETCWKCEAKKRPGPVLLRAIREADIIHEPGHWGWSFIRGEHWQEIVRLAEQCEKEQPKKNTCEHVWVERKDGYEEQCGPAICSKCGKYGCWCDAGYRSLTDSQKDRFHCNGIYGNDHALEKERREDIAPSGKVLVVQESPPVECSAACCVWTVDAEGTWSSSCGQDYQFTNDEGPVGNGCKFCHYCGKPLVEKGQQHGKED